MSGANRDALMLFCRVCLCYIFILAGWDKLMNPGPFAAGLASRGVPAATLLAWVAIVVELGGGLAILFGAATRTVAVLFIPYIIITIAIGHRYWELTGPARVASATNFNKNIVMIGAYAMLAYLGPGNWSLDALRGRDTAVRTA